LIFFLPVNFPTNLDLWGLFGSSFLAATLLPGGSEVVFALLAVQNIHSPPVLIGVATLGNTLGGIVTLGMGRLVAWRYPLRPLEQSAQQRASVVLHKYGPWSLLLSWIPIIGDPLCFVAGWLRLNILLSVFFIAVGKGARYAALWSVIG
jgi:membrane protein YqaA with SNARE-associated domain